MIARYRRATSAAPISTKHGMCPRVPLRRALADPALLGNTLAGPSWDRWKALLLAFNGEPLFANELAMYRESTGRNDPPAERCDEGAFVIGRRGGKDRSASVLACYFAALCEHPQLVPGERGVVFCIGADQRQAKVTRNYIEAALQNSPVLSPLIANPTQDSIQLTNGIDIEVRAANFRRVRGPTCIAVIATETAFWLGEDSSNPDSEILNALRPTLATTGGPLIQISSPYARKGELWETYRKHYGPNGDPRILVAQGASRTFNPTLPEAVVARAMERDSAAASAEFLAQFRSDLESYVSADIVRACTDHGVHERMPVRGVTYSAFVDPSGGSGTDSMTLAIGHKEHDQIIIDCLRERRPPFAPSSVVTDFTNTLKSYGVNTIRGDRYAGEWPREAFREHGITYECSPRATSDLYTDALPLLNSHRVRLLDNQRLAAQLCALERRTSTRGRDQILHPPSGHDDIATSFAGVSVTLASESAPLTKLITPELLAMSRNPGRNADFMSPRRQRMSSF